MSVAEAPAREAPAWSPTRLDRGERIRLGVIVVLLDPRRGRILMHGDAFDKAWSSAEYFTLLAVPADKQPPTDPMTSPSKTSSLSKEIRP